MGTRSHRDGQGARVGLSLSDVCVTPSVSAEIRSGTIIDAGGGECVGLNYHIDYLSLGQVVTGEAVGTNYSIENGFVNGATGE